MARAINLDDPHLFPHVAATVNAIISSDVSPVPSSLPLDSLTQDEDHTVSISELDQDELALLQWAELYRAYDVLNVIQVQTSTRKQVTSERE